MKILEINTNDWRGGAAQIAINLKKELETRGHQVNMLVKNKITNAEDIVLVNNNNLKKISYFSKKLFGKDLPSFIRYKTRDIWKSLIANDIEYFNNDIVMESDYLKEADLVHCHNLHGNFFNLKLLSQISKIKPVIWTLHDMWPITGHCSFSFGCNKWLSSCGNCPDLKIYPELSWDNTAYLFKRKKEIYQNAKLNVVAPSLWLKNKIEKSILSSNNIYMINNGLKFDELKNYNKNEARRILKLPSNKKIILFVSNGGVSDERKGWSFVEKIISIFNKKDNILFICVGNIKIPKEKNEKIKYIGYIDDRNLLSLYYSSADVFLNPSKAESFSLTTVEALSCQLPVVSFPVGIIEEIINHRINGYIAKLNDFNDLIRGVKFILNINSSELRKNMEDAAIKIRHNFSLEIMVNNYVKLYMDVLEKYL